MTDQPANLVLVMLSSISRPSDAIGELAALPVSKAWREDAGG